MKLSEERKGQIALLWLKNEMRQNGIRLKPDMKREVGNEAKAIGIDIEEAMALTEEIVRELVEEVFPPRQSTADKPDTDQIHGWV